MYSDQPTMPSSVVIFRKELTRQPASQCRSSILTIFTDISPGKLPTSPSPPLARRVPSLSPLKGGEGGNGAAATPSPPPGAERVGVRWGIPQWHSSAGRDLGEHRFEIGQEQRRVLAHWEM